MSSLPAPSKASRPAAAYHAAWVESMVKLAASCDIDAECRRRAAAPPAAGASAAPADLPRLVDEVSSCIALLRRDSPNNMPMLPDTALVQTLLALSTRAPNLFRLPQLTNALLYFMERSAPAAAAPLAANTPAASLPPTPLGGLKKKSPQLAVMAVTILDAAYRTLPPTQTWPLSFVRVLLEDYFDMRNWIDHDAAKGFIATITHSFKNWTPAPAAAEAMDESEGEEEITVEDSSDAIMTDAPSVAVSGSSSTAAVGSSSTAAVGSASTAAAAAAASATPRPAIAVPSSAMPMIPLGAAGRASSLGASSLLRSISSAAASKDLKQPVIPRYETQALSEEIRLMVERAFAVAIKANFSTGSRTGTNPMPAHLLRFLSISLGYRSLRHFTLLNLDAWLTHSSSNKGGKKLLVLVADELHKAAVLPHNIAAFDQVNVLNIPAKSLWNDLGANASTFTPETLHAWTRTTAPPAVPIDLQSIRLFMQVGMKVKSTMGGSQTASNSQWDQTYLQALTRLFRGPTHEPFSLPSATAVGTAVCIEAPSPCLLPASAWKAAFHSWIAQDWSHAASAAGWSQGVNQQPGHAPPAPAINTPALLYAPSHFILRVLDTFLVNPPSGGLLPVLSSYMLTILDKADYMHRMHLVLRRAMWLNTMYAYSNENISSLQSAGTAPTTVLDLFSLARRLLDWSLYDSVQNSALRAVKEPVLTDEQGRPVAATEAPAAVLQAHMAEVAKYHSRRETIITELLNVITWCCLLTSQPVVLLQSLSSGSISGGGPSFISKPASDGSADGARILPSQHIAAAESALQTWRFSAAFTQAKAMAWIQEWLVGFLDAPSNATVQPAEANAAPTYKDAAILFSDALTSLLFLHSSVQQFLLPFIGAPAPLSLISTPTSKSTPSSSSSSSSSGFFLADIWTLDQAFLKKSASALLLDKLPLLEDTITRLVMISIANPARLPHAHTIQILEILLRRVCQLALSVGKKYESTESDGPGILRIQNDGLLESILQLSQFPTPVPPPAPPGQTHPPLLAQSALFWRSCVLLVIASAFNPHTIGRRSWEQVPTLRCLLEMVVSEIWLQYPSSGGAPSQPASLSALYPPFPDLISKSLLNHKVGAEIDAILFVENLLPDNRPGAGPGGKGVPRTRETSLYLSHGYLMLLDPSEILRRPPEHILQTIQKLVSDFQLGAMLRSSMNPNFLTNMLSRQTPEHYVKWTRNLILADPSTMEIMPTLALAELTIYATERTQFQSMPSVLNGAAPMQGLSLADNRELARRKSRALSRQPSSNGAPSISHAAANATATVDPLLHHLPAMYTVLRRLLPTISSMYGVVVSNDFPPLGVSVSEITPTTIPDRGSSTGAAEPRASILSVLSPALGPTRHFSVTFTPAATPSTPMPRERLTVDTAMQQSPTDSQLSPPPIFNLPPSSSSAPSEPASGFQHTAFLDVLSMFLLRISSRNPSTRRSGAHGLHFWLCGEPVPASLDGPERRGTCCEQVRQLDQLGSESTPALPPATCWLKYFFQTFLHATDTPARSAPSFSYAFISAGRLVIRKLCTALMCALEVENDPDTLYGYISFLHATATRFSYSPAISPSKLFCLDLALRVCDVVLAREIVADKLLAPIPHLGEGLLDADASSSSSAVLDDGSRHKKRKLDHLRADSAIESGSLGPSSDALPMLDLGAFSSPQLLALDSARSVSDSASPVNPPRTGSPSANEKLHRCIIYSGYALVISVLSSAFSVVEAMQEDEKMIRRMLQREQKKADRIHLQGLTMQLSVPDSSPPTPLKATPQLKRSRSQMEEEDLDEAEDELADEASSGLQMTDLKRRYSSSANDNDAAMSDDPLNQSQATESVDEDFVTLHRSWPTCAQPILAYVPLPLLHGIISFLASPYALPPPPPAGAHQDDGTPAAMLQQTYERYQHLLTLLLPSAEAGHSVTITGALPTLPIKSGASWMIDFSGIQWPMPSELQAERFLEQSTTPMLLLLAIEVCSPIQLLAALTRFGLPQTLLQRIFTKLDSWSSYQVRLTQRQAPGGGGMTKSASQQNLALTPAMRELIQQLPKILHYVRLYQSTLKDSEPGGATAQNDATKPGSALLSYLLSLAPVPEPTSHVVQPTRTNSSELSSSLRTMLSNTPEAIPSLDLFHAVQQSAKNSPADFLRIIGEAVDESHCDLSRLLPVLQSAMCSLPSASSSLAPNFLSGLESKLELLKGSARDKSAYIHHDMACADLSQLVDWNDRRRVEASVDPQHAPDALWNDRRNCDRH